MVFYSDKRVVMRKLRKTKLIINKMTDAEDSSSTSTTVLNAFGIKPKQSPQMIFGNSYTPKTIIQIDDSEPADTPKHHIIRLKPKGSTKVLKY
jgi:hypothetical protein